MMKQKLFLLFALLLGTLVPHSVLGYSFSAVAPTGQRLYYTITDSSTHTVSVVPQYTYYSSVSPSGVLQIPASVTYYGTSYSVTSIGQYAFRDCTGLTSVTIPNSVTSIGAYAFQNCSSLTSVTIGNSVTSIGHDAFSGCSSLTSVTIPNSVTSIGYSAFEGCTGLTSITIPNSVTSIGGDAFYGCSGLTSVTIPNSVTSIGGGAFQGCTGLTSVTIPNSVTSIGGGAFQGCTGLTSVTIGNSVTSIGSWAFHNCSGLTNVTIPNSVSSIGSRAFSKCIGLTGTLTIPYSVTSIGRNAFDSCVNLQSVVLPNNLSKLDTSVFQFCSGLTNVTIPNSVTSIENYAFFNCSGLTSVTIPSSVTSIGQSAFSGCSGLTTLNFNADSCGGYGFSTNYHWLSGCTALDTVNIGNNVRIIPDYFALGLTGLTSVTIGNSVSSIGGYAFFGCSGLAGALTIPNSVTSIGRYAFYNCSGLTGALTISNSVTSIGEYAFMGCSALDSISVANGNIVYDSRNGCNAIIETATNTLIAGCKNTVIPNSVTSIGEWAFYNCDGLTSVTIPNSVTSIGGAAFYGCSGLTTLNFNADSCGGNGFSTNSRWLNGCTALATVNIGNNVRIIPDYFALGLTGLTSVTIPNSVTSIGQSAFSGRTGLTSITIPNSVTNIGEYAFSNCTGLTTLNYNADSCGGDGFYDHNSNYHYCNWLLGCTSLTTVNIGNTVRIIPNDFARGLTGLTSVTIGNSVTSIGGDAFYGCSGLTSVTIPNSVTNIGGYAFSGCSGLTILNFNADSCGGNGFSTNNHWLNGCTALATVNIGNNVRIIPDYFARGLTGLTSVTIGNSVSSIGGYAFSGCSGLTGALTIPNSVTSIGGYAFSGCSGLTSVTIPNSVTSIGGYAFNNCTGLTSVTIPNSVTSIGQSAFSGCSGMTSVTIPNSVTSIGHQTFSGCTGLTDVTIPNTVDTIQTGAFSNCTGMQVLHLGSALQYVGAAAFYNCDHLNTIYSLNPTPATVANSNAFENVWKGLPLIVPTGSRNAYAIAYGWREFTNIQEGASPISTFTVTVAANDATMGYVTGGGTYTSGATATLTATPNTGYHFVQWNDGNTDNPRTVTVTADATYMAYFAADQSNAPQIAYVGVDSNGHNAVSWTPQAGTSPVRYNVYREGIQAGVYELVGVVNASGAASYSWTDDQSNPATRAYSYRLAEVAADNTESDLSIPHTTIHLQINQGQGDAWNLAWTPYVGFNYSTYNLYRGTDASSMTLLTTLPATATTYSDLNTGGTAYYYQIEVVQLSGAKTTAVSSRSNIVTTDPDPQTYTLTVLSADVLRGTVSGGGSYTEGTMATLTAEANEGYVFLQWQDGSTANPRNILVTANGTYMAYFTQTEGIADAEGNNVTIIARNGRIQVSGAEGRQVMLSDALGRILYRGTATEPLTVEAPATGIYLLQVEGHPAHRISVVR